MMRRGRERGNMELVSRTHLFKEGNMLKVMGKVWPKREFSVDFVRKLHYNLFANMESSH